MTRSFRNFLALSFLLAVGALGFAEETSTGRTELSPKITVRVYEYARVIRKTYAVHGKTISEAIKRAKKDNPNKTGNPGETEWHYEYLMKKFDTSGKQTGPNSYEATATVTGAEVSATIIVTTPTWEEADRASPEDQKTWNKVIADLEQHEDGHVYDFNQGADEILKALLGTPGTGTGKTLAEAINSAKTNAIQKGEENAKLTAQQVHEKSTKRDAKPAPARGCSDHQARVPRQAAPAGKSTQAGPVSF